MRPPNIVFCTIVITERVSIRVIYMKGIVQITRGIVF